jgi:hypothetical protein
VNDAVVVRVRDRVGDGEHGRQQREPLREAGGLCDRTIERTARYQLHRIERRATAATAGIVDRHDRRMLEPRRDQGLAHEPPLRAVVAGEQLLDRDRPLEHPIGRA